MGILTVGVVTKPFQFEGERRMRFAEGGIVELQKHVDTLLVIPNQNLFRVANEKTTFADAFAMADQVLYSGVACVTDLMVKEGLINLDFADVRAVMREMGKAMMGTGEASGEKRAITAAEAAISNPLIDDNSMKGSKGLLISITGGKDLTLYEVDEAATRIREEVDKDANIIVGATFDESLEGIIRVSVVATGIDKVAAAAQKPAETKRPAVAAMPRPAHAPMPARRADTGRGRPACGDRRRRDRSGRRRDRPRLRIGRTRFDDVTIRPEAPKPTLFVEPAAPAAPAGASGAFRALHPAAAGAGHAASADAANRRIAAAGPAPDHGASRRIAGARPASGKAAHVASEAAGDRRPRPQVRAGGSAGAARAAGGGAADAPDAAAAAVASGGESRSGLRICSPRPAGSARRPRYAWPAGTCE